MNKIHKKDKKKQKIKKFQFYHQRLIFVAKLANLSRKKQDKLNQ